MTVDDLHHTAVHEAGHAVIARVLCYPCGPVTIEPDHDEGTAGFAITGDPWDAVSKWHFEGRVHGYDAALRARTLIYMAGAEAERALLDEVRDGAGDDEREISLTLDSLLASDQDPAVIEVRLRRLAVGLVHRHRLAIERVAAALLVERTIEDTEVCQILG